MFSLSPFVAVKPLLFCCSKQHQSLHLTSVLTEYQGSLVQCPCGNVALWRQGETAWILCSPWLTWCGFFSNSLTCRKKPCFCSLDGSFLWNVTEDGANLENMEACLVVVAEKLVCSVDWLGLVGFGSNAACCYTKERTEPSVWDALDLHETGFHQVFQALWLKKKRERERSK